MLKPNAIFISYRRSDSNDVSGRVYDRLTAHFGTKTIFKDVHSIPYGSDFPTYIQQELAKCQVLLAVIGPTWLTAERDGQRRLENPADWVRLEIQTALENPQITVIPLMVGGVERFSAEALPNGLQPLARLNSAQARPDPDFHIDMTRLVRRLSEIVGSDIATAPEPPSSTNTRQGYYLQRIRQLEERLAIVIEQLDTALGAEEEMALNNRSEQLSRQIENFQAKLNSL